MRDLTQDKIKKVAEILTDFSWELCEAQRLHSSMSRESWAKKIIEAVEEVEIEEAVKWAEIQNGKIICE